MDVTPADSLSVVMVTTSYPRWPGDHAGHFVASLARSIAESGNAVSVIAPHDKGSSESEHGDVEVMRVRYMPDAMERTAYGSGIVPNLKRDPRAWIGVPALRHSMSVALQEHAMGADIVHAHWAPTAMLADVRKTGKPVVLTLHGTDATMAATSRSWRSVLRQALAKVDGVICVSQEQADMLRELGLWGGPLEVIPAGVPTELFERLRPTRKATHPFTFVFVGRLIEEKGVIDLIEAFTSLLRRCAGTCRLVLVGTGPLEGKMRERVVARHLAGEVYFLGHLPHEEALAAVAEADVLVLPSYGEGSPLSVVEAMALGTPVIGTRVGAVPSLIGDDGLLVEPGDIAGLASAMATWASDPEAAARAGRAARERVAKTHSWPLLAERTVDFYRETISAAG